MGGNISPAARAGEFARPTPGALKAENLMKPLLTMAAVLALAAPALAESRSVLVVVTHDKDGKAAVTVHSDDKQDRRDHPDRLRARPRYQGRSSHG